MTRPKKNLTEAQKQMLDVRQAMEQCHADKAAAEEELARLNFTLQLHLANRTPDESAALAVEALRKRIDEGERLLRSLPRRLRELRLRQEQLRSAS